MENSSTVSAQSYLQKIMIISTFGGLLFGYDTGVVNGALPYMSAPDQLNLTPLQEGMVVSALLIGAAVGAIAGGKLADLQGRKKNIITLSVIFFIATLGCSLSPNFEVIVFFRFMLGLAVGGASVTVPAYLAEVSPSDRRGRMVTQNELMIVTGQFLAFVFNAIIAVALSGSPHIWRYMLSVATIPAIALFIGIQICPESPRWLVSKGKISDSLTILKKIRKTEKLAIAELNEIQNNIMMQAEADKIHIKEFLTPWMRRILLIGIGIATFTQLTGVNSIMYYGSQVLNKAGFSMQAAIIANTLNGLASVIGTSTGIYLMTKMRRRTMLTTGFCGTTLSLLMIAVMSRFIADSPMFPYIILCLTVFFLLSMQGMIGPILWLSISEIIPLRFRGFGMGICVFFVWITNFVIGLVFPSLLASFGLEITFMIFAVIGIISIIFTRLCVPETMGKTLEEIEADFRHYDHKRMISVGTHTVSAPENSSSYINENETEVKN